MRSRLRFAALVAAASLLPILVQAANFPDVSKNSPNLEAINKLVELGVVTGNPDGTFRPQDAVNRAAMLKMLYKASGKFPDPTKLGCFGTEFKSEAWFAPYVCDAYAHGYVKGYADGKFRPENPVSMAEAVKMMFTVFEIPQPDLAAVNVVQIANVPADAWFADYIYGAVYLQLLPLPGQALGTIYPNDPLSREQAAALVYAGWKLQQTLKAAEPTSSSSSSAESAASASSAASSQSSKQSTRPPADVRQVTFPFDDKWQFSGKNAISYNFTLTKATTVDVAAVLGVSSGIQCRLSKIESDGFVLEYHPGYIDGNRCLIHTYLAAGNYQLYLQPQNPNATFTVSAKTGTSFGNDGLPTATLLTRGQIRTDYLEANDLENWYKFTVTGPDEGVKTRVETSGTSVTTCEIYPWKDVDVYGFVVPSCNEDAMFTPGTYFVRVGHGVQLGVRQTFTIRVK